MKKVLKFLKTIFYVLIIIIIIFNMLVIITHFIGKKGYPLLLGHTYFVVKTGSMIPDIKPGDIVIVKLTNDVKIGDIITFKENNYFVTHRIVDKTINGFITKGDANNYKDNEIMKSSVVGKLVVTSSILGFMNELFSNYIFLGVIVIFLVLLNLYLAIEVKKKVK